MRPYSCIVICRAAKSRSIARVKYVLVYPLSISLRLAATSSPRQPRQCRVEQPESAVLRIRSRETFTGVVFQDPVITAEAPSRLGGSVVTFTPGACTARHSHPVGQTLFCLSGVGRICFKGEKPQVLNRDDTVNIPPDTMHWHGASPDRLFSHLALSEAGAQGQGTAWGTHVSDAEYNEVASRG